MKKMIFIVSVFLFVSCSQNKFYLEIKSLNNGNLSKKSTTYINIRNHDKYISDTNELVYHRSSFRNKYNGKFKTFHLIYNLKDKRVFLAWFENKKEILNKKEVQFDSISMKNINYFIKKDFDKIKQDVLNKFENSSKPQSRDEYYYLNIDSINKSYKFIIE